jgi:hypothetical protein
LSFSFSGRELKKMNIEEGKEKGLTSGDQLGVAYYPPQPAPGTYQGAPNPNYPPQQGAPNYPPQPATAPYQGAPYYPPQPAPGYPVSEAREHDRLPCCGCGYGWLLFILGFFLGIIPWYVGVILLICDRNKDKREKPGYIACAIMAVIGTVLVVVSVTTTRSRYNN